MGSMASAAFSFVSSSSHSSLLCRSSNRIASKLPQVSCSETSIISATTVMPSSSGNLHIHATNSLSSVLSAQETFPYKTRDISLPPKVIVEATTGRAILLKSEELDTESASAEAKTAARDVLVVCEDIQNLPKDKLLSNRDEKSGREKLTQIEVLEIVKLFKKYELTENNSGAQCILNRSSSYHPQLLRECPVFPKFEANSIQAPQNIVEKTTRSNKKSRTRTMKSQLLKNTTELCLKSASSPSTKKSTMIIVRSGNFSDTSYIHHHLFSTISLTDNEAELCQGLKDLQKLEKIRARIKSNIGHEPTSAQWAEAVGLDQGTLHRKLLAGHCCKDKIVKGAIRLVTSVAKKYQGRGVCLPDLIQEGCSGLLRGAGKFDHKKGFKFSTYVYWWIRQAITDAIIKKSRIIQLPRIGDNYYSTVQRYFINTLLKIRKAEKYLYQKFRRPPKDGEIACFLNLSVARIRFVKSRSNFPRSIDQHISQDNDSKLGEFIADPVVKNSEMEFTRQKVRQDIDELLEALQPREKEVIRLRFGLDGDISRTRKEVAYQFCVSKERIRQIESIALRKLKQLSRHKDMKCYLDY